MTINKSLVSFPLLALAACATAQSKNTFSVYAGWNGLLNSDAKDATNTSGFMLGVGYHVPSNMLMKSGTNFDSSLDLTWARNVGHSNRLDTFGLEAMGRGLISMSSRPGSPVAYLGLGVGVVDNQFVGGTSSTSSGSSVVTTGIPSAHKVTLGARALVGMNFSQGFFAEAAYNYNGSVGGIRVDSVSVVVGLHF